MSNKLEKDINKECNCYGYYGGHDSIYFEDGKLTASAYSYEIDGVGEVELTKEQTLEIYKGMKRYFEKDLLE